MVGPGGICDLRHYLLVELKVIKLMSLDGHVIIVLLSLDEGILKLMMMSLVG